MSEVVRFCCSAFFKDFVERFFYEWLWHLLKPHIKHIPQDVCIMLCGAVINLTTVLIGIQMLYKEMTLLCISVHIDIFI